MDHFQGTASEQTHVVIITALPKEKDAILRHLGNVERIVTKSRVFYRATIAGKNPNESYNVVLLSLAGMGNPNAAVATTQAIDVWNPQVIVLTGIAGGIKKGDELNLGDIIVAEQIVGYEQAKITDDLTNRRFDVLRPSHQLLETARHLPYSDWIPLISEPRPVSASPFPKVHFGVIASGEKVIAGGDIISSLQPSWARLMAVEMEGYGTALAAYQAESAPGIFMAKAICDFADSSKNDDWQEYAADVAATFTIAVLQDHPFQATVKVQAIRTVSIKYKGTSKITLCRRLGDEWEDLADYFDIPTHQRRGFTPGRECQRIWEWLEDREKLDGLKDALEFIDREDLVEVLELA